MSSDRYVNKRGWLGLPVVLSSWDHDFIEFSVQWSGQEARSRDIRAFRLVIWKRCWVWSWYKLDTPPGAATKRKSLEQ